MKPIKTYSLFALLFISSKALSGTQLYDLTLNDIAMGWGGEAVYVRINETIPIPEGCANLVFRMQPDTPLFSENLSILLSAFHANSKVRLYVDGCIGGEIQLKAAGVTK